MKTMKLNIKRQLIKLASIVIALGTAHVATAQITYTVLTNLFTADGPILLSGSVIYSTKGNKVNTDGTGETPIVNGLNLNATGPMAISGNTLYWVDGGGANGLVEKINLDGSGHVALHNFTNPPDGGSPQGITLVGNTLYGGTFEGGISNNGTIYKVNTDGTGYVKLYDFTIQLPNGNGVSNYNPNVNFPLAVSGSQIYGTTVYGGGGGEYGSVFALNTDGTGFTVLHYFAANGVDGVRPNAGLTLSGNTLYGTTDGGGNYGDGTVFKINTDGTGYTILHSFAGQPDGAKYTFESDPLTISSNTLYGTTDLGGISNKGTIFQINTDGSGYAVLYNFTNSGYYSGQSLAYSGGTLYGDIPDQQYIANYGWSYSDLFALNIGASSTWPPLLGIASAGANQSVLYWPSSAGTYTLQTSTNLSSTNWVNVTNGTLVIGMTVTNSSPAAFFRLH
jgi:uncharacterized repeat protein (TIGR03803 family)